MSPFFSLFFSVIGRWLRNFVVRSTPSIFGSSKISSDQLRNEKEGVSTQLFKLLHASGEPKFILSFFSVK